MDVTTGANVRDLRDLYDARLSLVLSAMGGLFTDDEQVAFDRLTDLLAESVPALLDEICRLRHDICLMEGALHEAGTCTEYDQIVLGVYCPQSVCRWNAAHGITTHATPLPAIRVPS